LSPYLSSAGFKDPDPSVSINSNIFSTVRFLTLMASNNLQNNAYSNYSLYFGLSYNI